MDTVSHCPSCHSLWHTLPNESPPYFYSTVIAVQSWETDQNYYMCPDCGTQFNPDGTFK